MLDYNCAKLSQIQREIVLIQGRVLLSMVKKPKPKRVKENGFYRRKCSIYV